MCVGGRGVRTWLRHSGWWWWGVRCCEDGVEIGRGFQGLKKIIIQPKFTQTKAKQSQTKALPKHTTTHSFDSNSSQKRTETTARHTHSSRTGGGPYRKEKGGGGGGEKKEEAVSAERKIIIPTCINKHFLDSRHQRSPSCVGVRGVCGVLCGVCMCVCVEGVWRRQTYRSPQQCGWWKRE